MARSKQSAKKRSMKLEEKEKPVEQLDEKMEEDSDDDDEEGELLAESDVEKMEKLSMDFEALPPHESDLIGLVNLITQLQTYKKSFSISIFLRTDIDCEGLAKKIVERPPVGCVYKPTEECEDDDEGAEGLVYGTLSVVNLLGKEFIK
uniref:Uncharacterized protein n=1 Tax=Ditylenchus dipsaci TaxID=166011 RepID=A0A915D306_9BILA